MEYAKKRPQMLKSYESTFGKGYVNQLLRRDPRKMDQEIEQLFDRMAKQYADIKENPQRLQESTTLGDIARRELFSIRDLAIGKPVPDIEGEDLESTKFKLSDYRVKVVLLDFWGHW